ncbi:MAG: heavy metal-associated domain-containing protein, partial [Sulfurimicrobium sp.]|nr:heavy metal-associated domain-containing protein [Sulfurimicrobium sp.]
MEKITLTVKGMTCMGCVRSVKNVLEPIPGVTGVDVTLENGQVTIDYDP